VIGAFHLIGLAFELVKVRRGVPSYRPLATGLAAGAIYLNFITHHWLPDLRWPLAAVLVASTWGVFVHFTVGPRHYRMPLAVSFVLIGFFLWLAENIATYLGAWHYPDQLATWRLVHPAKFGAWALLISVSFALIATWHAKAGRLRPSVHDRNDGTACDASHNDGDVDGASYTGF